MNGMEFNSPLTMKPVSSIFVFVKLLHIKENDYYTNGEDFFGYFFTLINLMANHRYMYTFN